MTHWPVLAGRSDGLSLSVGRAVSWHEPGWPKFDDGVPHAFATREIISAPTSVSIGASPAGNPAWQIMRSAAVGMLADSALMAGCSAFEVRYVVTPGNGGSGRIRVFLTAKARDWQQAAAQAAVAAACEKMPTGFGWATPESPLRLGEDAANDGSIVIELRRDEEVTIPQWDYIPADFYYMINDDPGDGSGWPGFWRTLVQASRPVTVSLLFQQTDLHWDERNVLGSVVTDLEQLSQQRTDYDIMGNPMLVPACMNARFALDSWKKRIQQLHRPLLARLAVRSDTSTAVTIATSLATAVGSSVGTTNTHPMYYQPAASPAEVRQANFSFDWLEILPWGGHGIWEDQQAPLRLRRLPYLFGLNEAATLMALPVPDEQGVAGMPRTRTVDAQREEVLGRETSSADDGVRLGSALHEGKLGSPIVLPLKAINRHALVVGASGSGKTTTVLSLLVQLWRDHQIPFMVIESVKTEYRSLIDTPGLEDLQVITLGNEGIAPMRLNPLAPPPGVRCEIHQSAVMASLKMALPLFPPLPQILAKALTRAYDRAGWDDESTSADGVAPPTLRDLLSAYQAVFSEIRYQGDAKNIGLAFQTRLEGLLQGSKGKLLDTVNSTDFDALLAKPVVIEMNDIQDADERAVLAGFLLDRVRAGAKRRRSTGGQLRHVTVIEEAHRLLAKANQNSGDATSGDQARADSIRAFCEAISELRSLGEGFILSSQSPSQLADAALANAGTRIVHRMESYDDRKAMIEDFGASDKIRDISARLGEGEAVVRWPQRDEVEIVKVIPDESVDSGRAVADEQVAEHMRDLRRQVKYLLPYPLCTSEVCTDGCLSKVRRVGLDDAEMTADVATDLWTKGIARGEDPSPAIARILAEKTQNDLQRTYCGAVHLSVLDAAYRLRPGQDDRPALVRTIRTVVVEGRS